MQYISEQCRPLPTEAALGHRMHTAGMPPNQFFWCSRCAAHTCQRARNLTKPCKGKIANPRALSRLTAGRHPYDDKNLATQPRRLSVQDVGFAPKEQDTWSEDSLTGCERPNTAEVVNVLTNTVNSSGMHDVEVDEDPFDFGFGLD